MAHIAQGEVALRIIVLLIAFIGFLLNLLILLVFLVKVKINSIVPKWLHRCQLGFDAYGSLVLAISNFILLLNSDHECFGGCNNWFYWFLCYTWSHKIQFWLAVNASTFILVSISINRLASSYRLNTELNRHARLELGLYAGLVLIAVIFLNGPNFFAQQVINGECIWLADPNNRRRVSFFFRLHEYLWLIFAFFVPLLIIVVTHSITIYRLTRHRQASSTAALGQSESTNNKSPIKRHLVLTTICLTVNFVVFRIYDGVASLFGLARLIDYSYGSILSQLAILQVCIGQCLNPLILVLTIKPIRYALIKQYKLVCGRKGEAGSSDAKKATTTDDDDVDQDGHSQFANIH